MALEGSLRDFDLFSLFNMIKTQGKSGTLVLTRSQEFVKVFFDQGDIVGCDSNQVRVEERIGAMLVRLGRLSGEELAEMIQRQRQSFRRLGLILLESGKVSPQDLQDALFNQAMSIIYRTFRWVEGDYRFDSILPLDLDRENFPPIPVDTVLMQAARIMDEWPEVQKRLPHHSLPLARTALAESLKLDLEQDLASILNGSAGEAYQRSGLSHEQETILTYFREPLNILGVLQITRYDELDTCKYVAELMEMGLLEMVPGAAISSTPAWHVPPPAQRDEGEPGAPVAWFWLVAALLLLAPTLTYVPRSRGSLNQGLASLQPAVPRVVSDPLTRNRKAWAFQMASPEDGGARLAEALGSPLEDPVNPAPELLRLPDPLFARPWQ
jgi:hypothetical protein